MHAAVTAAQQPQLALDPAPRGAQIEMPPALDATVVDLQRAGLTAHRADAPAAPQPDRHDHAQRSEADVDHRCPGQGEQPVQCRGDAHVALLVRPLSFEQPAACDAGRRRVTAVCATSEELLEPRTPCSRGYRYARLTHNSTGDPLLLLGGRPGLGLVALSVIEKRYRAVMAVLDGASVSEVAVEVGVSRQSLHA